MQNEIAISSKLINISKLNNKLSDNIKREEDNNNKDNKLNNNNYKEVKQILNVNVIK